MVALSGPVAASTKADIAASTLKAGIPLASTRARALVLSLCNVGISTIPM